MKRINENNSANDQSQILQQIADQWMQIMSTLPNRGRGEVLANCSEVLFSEYEPDTLFISLEKNWYRSFSSDRKLIQSVSDAIANRYGVQLQIRLIDSTLEERKSLTTIPPKPITRITGISTRTMMMLMMASWMMRMHGMITDGCQNLSILPEGNGIHFIYWADGCSVQGHC